jgi:hypothetical protein
VAVSTTTRPVTHTALAAVKKESRYDIGSVCALGSINKPEPISMIIKKLDEKIKAGGIFIELINLKVPDISEMAIRKIAATTGVFPVNKAHNDLSVFTKFKLERKTPRENRKTIIL